MHMPPATNIMIAGANTIAAADAPAPPSRQMLTEVIDGGNRDERTRETSNNRHSMHL